jgi:integrase/recombinase XerC
VKKYIGRFIDYLRYERNYSAHTVDAYISDLEQFAAFVEAQGALRGEAIELDLIDGDLARRWVMEMMGQRQKATTVNRKLSALQSFFRYLRRQGVIDKHPLQLVKGPKKPKPLPKFVKDKDMTELLDAPIDEGDFIAVRDRLMAELFYETGVRCAELTGLRDVDVDAASRTIKVTGKRNKQRYIPYADRLQGMIAHYINVRAREVGGGEAFFVRSDGRQLTSAIVYYAIKKQLSTIDTVGKRSPHVLRHTFATSMLNGGAGISTVRTLMGHASLAATSVYTHLTFEELKHNYNAHPRAQIKEE